jgi:hypothetical protein
MFVTLASLFGACHRAEILTTERGTEGECGDEADECQEVEGDDYICAADRQLDLRGPTEKEEQRASARIKAKNESHHRN